MSIYTSTEAARARWKTVKEIFHAALRLEPAERERFLSRECEGDDELRIEVESLLLSLNEANTFLEEPALSQPLDRDNGWQFGNDQIVSHYKILEPIGAGGMAEVYLAEDTKLRRQVALKVLPPEVLKDVDRLRRFKREALAVSALNHPNILTIFEFDAVGDINLLASEYVKGKTLREAIKAGPVCATDAIQITEQVASALATAHTAGVIHRDIKPENIMVRDDGYVKVLDFGLAKLIGDMRSLENEASHSQAFSLPGLIMGTVTYMSPEQARSLVIDSRTDIFSLGIVLYEMLASRPPFSGEFMTDVIAEIIQKEPIKVSEHNPDVPEELVRIVSKCLEKDRSERYQTADELITDLRRVSNTDKDRMISNRNLQFISSNNADLEKTHIETLRFDTNPDNKKYPRSLYIASVLIFLALMILGYWYFN